MLPKCAYVLCLLIFLLFPDVIQSTTSNGHISNHNTGKPAQSDHSDVSEFSEEYYSDDYSSDASSSGGSNSYSDTSVLSRDKNNQQPSERPLKVGDTFTPQEMLVIAKMLMEKIKKPGSGTGIVSSAVNSQELADALFRMYFNTLERIVELKQTDIPGLDALQALAMSGREVKQVDLNNHDNSDNEKNQCSLKLALKTIKEYKKKHKKGHGLKFGGVGKKRHSRRPQVQRRKDGIREKAAKHLAKNRTLVIYGNNRKHYATDIVHTPKRITSTISNLGNKSENCRWRYECTGPIDLNSCHITPDCDQSSRRGNYIKTKNVANSEILRQFREKVGITEVDEEVEKIVEKHLLALKIRKPGSAGVNDFVKSVRDYFNEVLLKEERGREGITRPMQNGWKTTASF